MKKSAVKTGVTVLVLIAVILWSLLTNYFRGAVSGSASAEVETSENKIEVLAQTVSQPVVVSTTAATQEKAVSAPPISVSVTRPVVVASANEDYANSKFCRAQYQELLRIPEGRTLRLALRKEPNSIDKKCFAIPDVKGVDSTNCFNPPTVAKIFGPADGPNQVADTLCSVFLEYYKYMLTDYLNPITGDLTSIPDDILRAKTRAQFVPRANPDSQLMNEMAKELIRRHPDELKYLKIFLQAQYLTPGTDFSNTGLLYPYIIKAYKLAPQDKEVQQFVTYSVMMSDRGLFKLAELEFLKDDYYSYYFFAWFHWKHKTDLQKTKLHLTTGLNKSVKYKYLFESTLKQVNDKKTFFGQENVFRLSLEPMPPWETL